jgi:glyceraldehyde-3-phosphate dehydrogenase/erythrose-4-phosphate dehydrogenase
MLTRIAINGFPHTGRMFFRAALYQPNLEPVAVNDFINGQMLQDRPHKGLRHAWAATLSMMPTSGDDRAANVRHTSARQANGFAPNKRKGILSDG